MYVFFCSLRQSDNVWNHREVFLGLRNRDDEGEDDREEKEAVEETKDHSENKDLEEGEKHMRGREDAGDEGEESGEATIEDSRSDGDNGTNSLLLPGESLKHDGGKTNVNGVVHTEANRENYADAGDHIYGGVPKVEKAYDIGQCDENHDQDSNTDTKIGHKDESNKDDTSHG